MQTQSIVSVIFIIAGIIFTLILVIVTLLYFYQKRQVTYQQSVNKLKLDFEKNLLRSQVEIQEQTFQHISREIHDNINLSLTLAKLNLTATNVNFENYGDQINSSVALLAQAIVDLNNLSKSTNTELIREMGLIKAIKAELDKIINIVGLQVDYEIRGEPIFMDSEKELVVFRIVQEAFNNVIKHSKATKIWLELNYSFHFLDLMIRDNGVGFDRKKFSGIHQGSAGLRNMTTRARLFGGQFLMESQPDKGTQILVSIPYYS